MICACGAQTFAASKKSVLLLGLIITWHIKLARSHQNKTAYISTYAELLEEWSSDGLQRSQQLVLTSHITVEPQSERANSSKWIGVRDAESYGPLALSIRGSCAEPPPAEWRVHGEVLPDQCVLRFPDSSDHTLDQLIRIEGAVHSNFDIRIADLYIISGRLVDLEVASGTGRAPGRVNLWTSNVTLQDTPVRNQTNQGIFSIFPPHGERHEGATFINPCGPALTTLSSTACIKCKIVQCNSACTSFMATPACESKIPTRSAIAAIADAGTGNLLLQGLTTHACEEPIAEVVPVACTPLLPTSPDPPGALHVFADTVAGATAEFNRSIVGPPELAPLSLFLPKDNPVFRDLCGQHGRDGPPPTEEARASAESGPCAIQQASAHSSTSQPANATAAMSEAVSPGAIPPTAEGEPTWVIIGIVIASIAIAVLSLLLLLLLRPCKVLRRSTAVSTAVSARSTSDKSTLTHPADQSDSDPAPPQRPAVDGGAGPEDDTDTVPVTFASRNAVDCGRPDARSADWARDPNSPAAIEASVHALSRQRVASVLQLSLEQADMYMHQALGHKAPPPFRDSSVSATSGRSSRSNGMQSIHQGRPMDSLSAASLSAASAAAASSAAMATARPRSDSRESQRQLGQGAGYLPSSLSYTTSAADPAYWLPQQPDTFAVPQHGRGYSSAGVASPQWVHSAGSEASGRGFNMLPGWQEETQDLATPQQQSALAHSHARMQRRRMSSGAQYAYSGAWGSFGTGSSTEVSPFNHLRASGAMAPMHGRHTAEVYEADAEALRTGHTDARRWSAGVDPGRLREMGDRGAMPRDWTSSVQGEGYALQPGQHAHTLAMQQRRQQERLAFQYETQYREAQRW
eukprot:jgi/Ulvmu1/3157/UM015_0197.1